MKTYDVAVLGMERWKCHGFGASSQKCFVIGFDQFAPPHSNGSHSGDTRVFRLALYDNPRYVPLVKRAGALWDKLSADFGRSLVNRIGYLKMGLGDR